jgi:hypothetical protein
MQNDSTSMFKDLVSVLNRLKVLLGPGLRPGLFRKNEAIRWPQDSMNIIGDMRGDDQQQGVSAEE